MIFISFAQNTVFLRRWFARDFDLRSSIFWIFKLSRVNWVYAFLNFFPSYIFQKNLKSWFFSLFLFINCDKNRHLVKKRSLSKSSRKQNWRIKVHSMFNWGKLSRSMESSKMWKSKQNYFIQGMRFFVNYICT